MLPLVIRIKGLEGAASKETQYVFTHSPVRIGRNQLNDLHIPQPFVSQFHALVRFDEKATYVVDLGSTNGVTIDDQRIGKNVPVPVGEALQVSIGSIEMRLSRDASAVGAVPSPVNQLRAMTPSPVQLDEEARTAFFSVEPVEKGTERVSRRGLIDETEAGTLPGRDSLEALEDPDDEQRTILVTTPFLEKKDSTGTSPRQHPAQTNTGRAKSPTPGGVQGSLQELTPLYSAYRNAWQELHAALARQAGSLETSERKQLISQLQQCMPGIVHEPQFEELAQAGGGAGSAALAPAPASANRLEVTALELLGQFVRCYLPGSRGFESGKDIARFLSRLSEVLETFGRAFVELRQGHDQFGHEIAVPVANDATPLTKARSTREVLRYLLDWRGPKGSERVHELKGGFGDVMIHQIALLNGMREGVRDMLQDLLPEAPKEGSGWGALLARLWPFQASRQLRQLEERLKTLLEEERELTSVLFGPEFAKAYLSIVGGAANGEGEEEGSTSRGSDRREQEARE